jgi:hypothetical protein
MWEPRRLTNLWVSTACYRDTSYLFSFTFIPDNQIWCSAMTQDLNGKVESSFLTILELVSHISVTGVRTDVRTCVSCIAVTGVRACVQFVTVWTLTTHITPDCVVKIYVYYHLDIWLWLCPCVPETCSWLSGDLDQWSVTLHWRLYSVSVCVSSDQTKNILENVGWINLTQDTEQ